MCKRRAGCFTSKRSFVTGSEREATPPACSGPGPAILLQNLISSSMEVKLHGGHGAFDTAKDEGADEINPPAGVLLSRILQMRGRSGQSYIGVGR